MPADASIYSLIQPIKQPDLLGNVGQAMQLKQLMGQGQLQDLQRSELERGISEEGQLRDLFRRGTPKPEEVYAISPKRGAEFQKSALDSAKTQGEIDKTRTETLVKNMGLLKDRLPTVRDEASFQAYVDFGNSLLGPDMMAKAKVPPSYDPRWVQSQLVEAKDLFTPKLVERTDGQRKWMEDTNPFTNPAILSKGPTQMQTTPDARLADERSRTTSRQPVWDSERGVFVERPGAAPVGGGPASALGIIRPGGLPPKAGDIASMRKEFNDLPEVKNYRSVVPIINSAANAPDNKAGDIQFAYTIGKIFDPNSVVREGELKLVGEAANVMQKYMGELQALTQGRGRLTAQTRSELLAAAHARAAELKAAHDGAKVTYERTADAAGLPKDQIFLQTPDVKPQAPAAPSREDIDTELRRRGVIK